jgi:hypothetical protein
MSDDLTGPVRPRRSGASVPIWVLVFVSALFIVTCVSLWAFISFTRPTVPQATSSAVFIVVTPAFTAPPATLDPLVPTNTSAPGDPTQTDSTPTVPANQNPGFITLGAIVEVAHTDGAPLKLRAAPSLTGEVNYLALPSEVFKVQNGPTVADGFTWWYLVAPSDTTRNGWAVENYLAATTNP